MNAPADHWAAQLRDRVAQEAAARQPQDSTADAPLTGALKAPSAPPAADPDPPTDPTALWLRPPRLGGRRWCRQDFVAVPRGQLVTVAYRALLLRDPDPGGLAAYGPQCDSWLGCVGVLRSLGGSAEAQRAGNAWGGSRLEGWMVGLARRWPATHRWLNRWLLWWDAEALYDGLAQALHDGLAQGQQTAQRALHEARTLRQELHRMLRTTVRQELDTLAAELPMWQVLDTQRAVVQLEQTLGTLQRDWHEAQARWSALAARAAPVVAQVAPVVADATAGVPAATAAAAPAPASAPAEGFDAFYVAFEDACRGTTEAIWAKQTPYLPELPPAPARVVDLGCGRGEWLQLLQAHGYAALGVEPNADMVQRCLTAGVAVEQMPALPWLQAQPAQSVDVITGFHVAEHVPFAELLQWLREAHRVLRPQGLLILETPNPENVLVGSHTFYHDPTHRNPLTPTLLQFAYAHCGFAVRKVLRLNPYPPEARVPGTDALTERVNGHFCGPQDYAVVGVRA